MHRRPGARISAVGLWEATGVHRSLSTDADDLRCRLPFATDHTHRFRTTTLVRLCVRVLVRASIHLRHHQAHTDYIQIDFL